MKATSSIDRFFGGSRAVLLVVTLSFFGLCVACFLAEGNISRNARPLLTLAGTVFAITLLVSTVALEMQLPAGVNQSRLSIFFPPAESSRFRPRSFCALRRTGNDAL